MCERHEQLYKDAAERLMQFLEVQHRVEKNTADELTIVRFLGYLPHHIPPGADTNRSLSILSSLVASMATSRPPFPIGTPWLWLVAIRNLLSLDPSNSQLVNSVETIAKMLLTYKPMTTKQEQFAYHTLAAVYADVGQYQLAMECFRKYPRQYDTDFYMRLLVETGEYSEALKLFSNRFSDIDPVELQSCNPVDASYLARALEGVGRLTEAAEVRKRIDDNDRGDRKPLMVELKRKMEKLLPEEKTIIEQRFGLAETPSLPHCYGDTWDGDKEFVKHVEQEALRKLGMTYEELISINYPGFVHNEEGPSASERSKSLGKIRPAENKS